MYKQIKISKNEKFINLKKFFKQDKKLNINLNLPLISMGWRYVKLKLFFDKYKINPDYIIDKKKNFWKQKSINLVSRDKLISK